MCTVQNAVSKGSITNVLLLLWSNLLSNWPFFLILKCQLFNLCGFTFSYLLEDFFFFFFCFFVLTTNVFILCSVVDPFNFHTDGSVSKFKRGSVS